MLSPLALSAVNPTIPCESLALSFNREWIQYACSCLLTLHQWTCIPCSRVRFFFFKIVTQPSTSWKTSQLTTTHKTNTFSTSGIFFRN